MSKRKESNEEEDIVFEEEEGGRSLGKSKDKLKDELRRCEKEKKEYLDGWQRARADFSNLKKKSEEERSRQRALGREDVIEEFLTALDSFEMAFAGESWEKVDTNWRTGIEYIYSQMLSGLENFGVKQLNPAGEKFDPQIHTSVESVETPAQEKDGFIAEVVQRGYRTSDKLIRSPKVKVYNYIDE